MKKTKGCENVHNLATEILWNFLNDCIKGRHPNPDNEDYRKSLSIKEEKIIFAAKARLPNLKKILTSAIALIQKEDPKLLNPKYIKHHFSECAIKLEHKAFSVYLKSEEELFLSVIEEWVLQNAEMLSDLYKKISSPADFSKEVCKHFYPLVQRMEFDSSQTRKARGGKTFEYIIEYLLKSIGIPCERPWGDARRILKRIDLVVPNQNVALTRPDKAYFLSCKRTLRERWKQTIPERKPSWRVFCYANS